MMEYREWASGLLGKETHYRLFVSGKMEPKQISKLISILECLKEILSDDGTDVVDDVKDATLAPAALSPEAP
jgi:hypothetical protein